jgi:hypothetical protein
MKGGMTTKEKVLASVGWGFLLSCIPTHFISQSLTSFGKDICDLFDTLKNMDEYFACKAYVENAVNEVMILAIFWFIGFLYIYSYYSKKV